MMNEEIRVHVVKYPDRENLVMRYNNPLTGRPVARSTRTTRRREAERVAAKWESALREGRYQKPSRMTWEEFREKYEENGMGGLGHRTVREYSATLNAFEAHCRPRSVAELTTAKVTAFTRELRRSHTTKVGRGKKCRKKTTQLSEASVAKHLRHLKVVLRWAYRQGILRRIPSFDMPRHSSGARRMKGRPITLEELERMLAATPKVVGEAAADSWRLLLQGLWVSGLRLGEAMALRWDQKPDGVCVMLDGQKSVLAFDADSQKSGKVELVPLAPEAVELLGPLQGASGYVFRPRRRDAEAMARDTNKVSKIISKIGKAAAVVVDPGKGKSASAHDLRRAFGYRWSRRVMPVVLKELMRHASIETTMTYYVGQNAQATTAELWKAFGNNLGNNGHSEALFTPAGMSVSRYYD